MGKSAGMGKYYIRKDGTTVADDHRDRRYKLIHKESVASPMKNDAGQRQTFKGSESSEYVFKQTGKGTETVVAKTAEEARRKAGGGALTKSEKITKKRKK